MAPSTPPSSQDIRVRAVIALSPLELSEKYSLDDDVVTTVPGLIRRVSEQFDQALCLDEPFDYTDFEFFPGVFRATVVPYLAYHLHRAGF
jgi:hypothetical protein